MELATKSKITWCPGCPNGAILVAFREAITELCNENKMKIEDLVVAAGVGCHGKIADYLNVNTFAALHGRVIANMTGIKVANPKLKVVGFSGDGDSYAEGLSHLVHAAQRNPDMTLFIHDNQVFALTTGQATPVSPKGFKGVSRPSGSIEEPLNPLLMMLSAGATFVARTYAVDIANTKKIMRAAMEHKGFAFVDIIQPCVTFFDTREYYKDHVYWLDDSFPVNDVGKAIEKVTAKEEKTALGIFYKTERPTLEELI